MTELPPVTLGLLFLAGFAGGFIDAIAGGGGLITVPALLATGMPPQMALGRTSCSRPAARRSRWGVMRRPG